MSRLGSSPAALCAAVLVAPAAAAATPLAADAAQDEAPPVNEESPSAAPGEFAWVQNSRLHPHLYNAYAQNGGGARFRVNPAGTQAGLGTGIDGHTLVVHPAARRRSRASACSTCRRAPAARRRRA